MADKISAFALAKEFGIDAIAYSPQYMTSTFADGLITQTTLWKVKMLSKSKEGSIKVIELPYHVHGWYTNPPNTANIIYGVFLTIMEYGTMDFCREAFAYTYSMTPNMMDEMDEMVNKVRELVGEYGLQRIVEDVDYDDLGELMPYQGSPE